MTTISVKAKHIAKGRRGDCGHCPVALAILDAIPGIDGVAVGSDEISISRGDLWIPFLAPREVAEFVAAFDSRDPVSPFAFDLDFPEAAS